MTFQPNSISGRLKPKLAEIVSKTEGQGAVVWDCNSRPYRQAELHYASPEQTIQLGCTPEEHLQLMESVLDSGQPRIALPRNESAAGIAPALLLVPITSGDSEKWIVESFQHPEQTPEQYKAALALIIEILARSDSANLEQSQESLDTTADSNLDLDEYCDLVHQSIQSQETAARIANETRRLLDCDRVSVIRFQGSQSKMVAISGQQSVNRRSNTVRLLENLAKTVLPLKEEFIYPPEGESSSSPQVDTALEEYLKLSVSRSIVILPLFEKPQEEIAEANERPSDPKLIGGIIVENFTETWDLDSSLAPLRKASLHASNAYANALQHESLWLYPVWRLLGKSKFLTATRRLPITLSIAIGLLLLTLALILIPGEFKVVCDGELVPQEIHYIYAPVDGEVLEVVPGGAEVPLKKNQIDKYDPYVIAKLVSHDLQARISEIRGQLDEVESRLQQKFETIDLTGNSNSNLQNEGELQAQRESLLLQLGELSTKADKLSVKSKLAGTVLTHSTEEQLIGRPFKRGDKLLEVADTNGQWIVELRMPDDRIGHVLRAQSQLRDDLKVTCVLSTDASRSFTGRILEVARSTEIDSEKGQTVLIKVEIDAEATPEFLRTRAKVVGKVHCGRRSLGYVWFHQVGEFLQKNVWFRIW